MKILKNCPEFKPCLFLAITVLLCCHSFAQTGFYKVFGNTNTDYLWDMYGLESNSVLVTGFTYNASSEGVFCSKIDSNGNIIWNKTFGSSHSNGYTIFQMNNRIFIGGANINNNGNAEIYSIDTDGNLDWAKEFDLAGNENIISISNVGDKLILIGNTSAFGNEFDILFIKIDTSGNVLLAKKIGTENFDEPRRIIKCCDGTGFLIIGGYLNQLGESDAFAIKINNDGEVLWSYRYGGSFAEVLSDGIEMENGDFVLTGTNHGFGYISNDGDIWVLSIDSLGNTQYSRNYGKYGMDRGKRIIGTDCDSFFITGSIWGYGNGDKDAFVLGIDSSGNATNFETFGGDSSEHGVSIVHNGNNSITLAGYTTSFGFGPSDFFILKKDLDDTICHAEAFSILKNPTCPNILPYPIADSTITIQEKTINNEFQHYLQTDDICSLLNKNSIDSNKTDFLIYPNPATDILNIEFDKRFSIQKINLIDMQGRLVKEYSSGFNELNVSDIAAGNYFLSVYTNQGNVTKKVVVK